MAKETGIGVIAEKQGNDINVIIQQKDIRNSKILKKHVGEWVSGDAKQVVFLSRAREAMFFINEHEYIQFRNNTFVTNKPEAIGFLREHSAFGLELFEKEFPQHIKQQREEQKRYITRDPGEHES